MRIFLQKKCAEFRAHEGCQPIDIVKDILNYVNRYDEPSTEIVSYLCFGGVRLNIRHMCGGCVLTVIAGNRRIHPTADDAGDLYIPRII